MQKTKLPTSDELELAFRFFNTTMPAFLEDMRAMMAMTNADATLRAVPDINTLVPASGADSDVFLCMREPHDGFVVLDGYKIPCAGGTAVEVKVDLGTLKPGESKTVTIPLGK